MQEKYDASEHTKNVYAHFGLAYYLSGVFETGLALAILKADFLSKEKSEIDKRGNKHFDRVRFEADFDKFLRDQHALTLGTLIKRMQQLTTIPEGLKVQLGRAKERRNFLAHHFFRERAEEFMTRRGRDKMLAELGDDQKLFETVDEAVTEFVKPFWKSLGIGEKVIQGYVQRYMSSLPKED